MDDAAHAEVAAAEPPLDAALDVSDDAEFSDYSADESEWSASDEEEHSESDDDEADHWNLDDQACAFLLGLWRVQLSCVGVLV